MPEVPRGPRHGLGLSDSRCVWMEQTAHSSPTPLFLCISSLGLQVRYPQPFSEGSRPLAHSFLTCARP